MSETSPEGWKFVPLSNLARVVSGGTPSRDVNSYWGGDIPWVTPTDITRTNGRYLLETQENISRLGLSSSSATLLPPNAILMTSRATVGESRISVKEVCTNQGFKSLVPQKGVNGLFLYYQMQRLRGAYKLFGIGSTFLEVSKKDTERFSVLMPVSEGEQKAIAAVIDSVDVAIEKTEALIAKYQQIKAGLMHDLFTRGVTADGKLRPPREQAPELYQETPIGWIPKEWAVKSLGALAEIVSGVTLGAKGEISDEVEVPYLRVANVQDGYIDLTEVKTIRVSRSQFEKLQLRYGDVLMNEGGDFDKLGRGSVWQEEIKPCIHQNHVFRVRPKDSQLRSYFLAFWSQSEMGKKYFVLNSKQSTNLASINSTQLNRFPVALPSPIEQERIETKIAALNFHADSLVQELSKLRQQKHGLMHDLLTGRVSVPVVHAKEGVPNV
jgi:type I restriction enzyme S subunit